MSKDPSRSGHDTLVRRLAMMLVKLNRGESLEPRQLAEEFGVNLRTIQRDLNDRFGYLPLEKVEGRYRLDPAYLGRGARLRGPDIDPLLRPRLALTLDGSAPDGAAHDITECVFEVVLRVSPEVAPAFKRHQLIAHQVILRELEDEGLIVSTRVGHLNQVFPHVRYWIPNIRIVSPDGLQRRLENDLRDYIDRPDADDPQGEATLR